MLYLILKRLFDILIALFMLVFVLSWLSPLLLIFNFFEDGRPLLFVHQREGKQRKLFWCIKYCTFPKGVPHPKPGGKIRFRVSWLGAKMRSSGIDELPQMVNVLLGHMSIIGPRPHIAEYNAYYQKIVGKEQMDSRHTVKPGLSGLAQIRGYRGETPDEASIKNRISSDLEYIKKQSLTMDGMIIIKSFNLLIESFTNKLFQKQTPNY